MIDVASRASAIAVRPDSATRKSLMRRALSSLALKQMLACVVAGAG
jgi:hypothetical protein